MKAQKSERGQVLVIIILVIVGMMGFAALAVDGGQLYAERRRAQNAADAAAYKVAFTAANNPGTSEADLEEIANDFVNENGFVMDTSLAAADQKVKIEYHHPPISGVYATHKDKEQYYQVFVTTQVEQGFSQFVFVGNQKLTVEAVARARGTTSITPGQALHAASKDASPALEFAGAGNTDIFGGDAFSNSNVAGSGKQNGSGYINVDPPHNIEVAGTFEKKGGSGDVSTVLNKDNGIEQQDLPELPVPDCYTDMPARSKPESGNTLLPGRYESALAIHNGSWTMAPGMYCFMNGFSLNGGELFGKDIFIVVKAGALSFAGNGTVDLRRANKLKDGTGNPNGDGNNWGGMLFYVESDDDVSFLGSSASSYTGTIYAPHSFCNIGGTQGSIGLSSNVICDTIRIDGNAKVLINYKEPQNYKLAPMVELAQ